VPQGDVIDQQLETMLDDKFKAGILKRKAAKPAKSDSETAENKVKKLSSTCVSSSCVSSSTSLGYNQQQHLCQQQHFLGP